MQIKNHWFFIPVICEETGWYGGNVSYYFPNFLDEKTARKYAFIYLERKISAGEVERREYGK